jgi:hypothetical protein
MLRQAALLCAVGMLAAGAGCSFKWGNNLVQVDVKANEQVVNDTLDQVAQRIESEMRRLGLQVAVAPSGDAVRITSTTKTGQRFVVVLKHVTGPRGEQQTNLRVEWDQAPDRELWSQLLLIAGQVAVSTR